MTRSLTSKQRLFADVFDGNGTEACRKAGYKGGDNVLAQQARENLRNPQILAIIQGRQAAESRPLIASRKERQEFWTQVMQSPEYDPRDRLKASELLGKSEADFTEKHEHSGGVSIGIVNPYAEKPDGG